MYPLKFLLSVLGPQIDVSLQVPCKYTDSLDVSMLDLEFLISFLGREINFSLKVPSKFPGTLDRCISSSSL